MPEATANGTVTVSSTADGIDDFVFNVSGTIRDESKMWVNFAEGLPEGWTNSGNWTISTTGADGETSGAGYAYNTSYESNKLMYSPLLTFAEGEKLYLMIKGHGATASWNKLNIQYSADGTNWTNAKVLESITNTWQSLEVSEIPAGNWYIGFYGSYVYFTDIYGGTESTAPVIALSQTSYDFGLIAENTTSEAVTITNTGKSALTGLNIISSNPNFTVNYEATEIAANGGTATFTVTMAPNATGAQSATITIKSDNADDLTFTATGAVAKEGTATAVFNDATLAGWTKAGNTSFNSDETAAYFYYSTNTLTSPKVSIASDDFLAINAKIASGYGYVTVQGSADGTSWTDIKKLDSSVLNQTDYTTAIVSGISTDYKYLRLNGYYCYVKQVAGLNYAPVLTVTQGTGAVSSPAAYAFGEVGANQTVTYNFTNTGAGTINITNVASDNEVFTTNWTEAVVADNYDLIITVNYDAAKAGEQNGTVTVTTTEGEFVINLTSTFLAANAPKFALFIGEAEQTTGADLGFGIITEAATKEFIIKNDGTGALNVTGIALPDAAYTTDLEAAPSTESPLVIAAGTSKTINVTLAATAKAIKTGNIVISADGFEDFSFVADAYVLAGTEVIDFNTAIPSTWENESNGWSIFNNEAAKCTGKKNLTTSKLSFTDEDFFIFKVKASDSGSGDYVTVEGSADNGATWTAFEKKTYSYSGDFGANTGDYSTIVVSGISSSVNKIRFNGYYVLIDEIAGLTYDANDPKMGIYSDADCTVAATTSVAKDFGFVTEDATETYYIKNDGTGTLALDQEEMPAGFSAVLGESELAAGESTTLTITFGQISGGYRGGNIVVNGSDGGTFTVAVSGVMVDEDKLNLDFATADIPSTWTAGSWAKKDGGYVEAGYTSTTMETNVLTAVAGETLVVVAKNTSTYSTYKFGVKYKKADAEEWSDLIAAANLGTEWKTLTATIEEAGDYQLQFTGNYAQIKHIYGLTEPTEPVMVVYDGEAKAATTYNFGNVANDADATHTFTVKNEGKAVLAGLTATLSGDQAFHYDVTISGLTDGGVAANGEATITVTQKKDNLGSHAATLTISSTSESIADFVIELSGVTRDASKMYVDFADGNMPTGWTVGTSWTVTSGYAQQTSYSTASALVTTPLTVAEGETLSFEAARYSSYSAAQLKVRYTTDGGITWSEYVDYAAQITSGSFVTLTLTDVPAGTAIVEFYGRYVKLDNISGFVPTTAPVFALTEGTTAVANGSTKEFGNLTEAGVATYTLTNNGTADMVTTVATTGVATAAISGEGEGITIADNTVTLAAGKSATITLTLPYEAPFGEKTGAMTLTSEGWVGDFSVNYTATTIDPTALFVDFSSNAKPAGWYNSGFSFTSGAATINSNTEATLITEKLTVSGTDDVLSYDAVASSSWASNYASLVVSYSTDRQNWIPVETQPTLSTTAATFNVSGLDAGEYYLQFKGKYVTVDNISGWHKVTGIEHDLFFVSIDVPEGEYVPGSEYTATVKVVNLRAASETVAAELFVKNEKAAELTEQVVALDETKTFTLTAIVPEEGKHLAYVKVYNNDVTIETEPVTFTSAHNRTLEITGFARTSDETVDADANNEFTSTFNVTVKNNGTLAQDAENVSVSITDADGNVIGENATAWTLANSQTVFINPGAYTTDGAVLAIWRWNTDVDGEWALFTKINDELYSVERNGKTNFCIVRLKKEGDEGYSSENGGLNWTNCYNQSTNMKNTDGNFFSFKSWGDVNGEGHQWFNFGTMANLPIGASTTMSVSLTTSALEGGVLTFKAKENVSNTVSTASATVTVNAAAPKFELALGTTAIKDGDAVAYGIVKAATTKTFTISNTGNKLMEAPSISVPEGFEYEKVAANGADADWILYFYRQNTDLNADQGTFKTTATDGEFIIENVNVPFEGVNFAIHNNGWSTQYGYSDEGGHLNTIATATKLATATEASGWMTIPAGNYDFVWNANDLTLLAKPAGSILAGETADVNVTLKAEQGKVSGNLVFTYKVDATTNNTFNVALSGRSVSADTWAVDFEDGNIPADWDNSNNWTVGESEGNHYATLTGWNAKSIMTPRLAAEANEELTFDVLYVGSSFTYAYSTDKTNWSDEVSVSATGEQTFVAPAAGNYYLRFTTRNGRLDNLVGFRANPLEHDTEIAASSVPATGKQYNVYTATVTLKESVGKAEEVTACLYVGGEVKATETLAITANGSTTVTLTWEPQVVISEAVEAYVAVTGTGIDLATEPISLTIAEVYTLDEETSASTVDAVSNETVLLKRKFAAGWNTVCLPFAINDVEAFFGTGAKAYDFTAYNTTNGELNFSTVSTLSASYPYVVYVPEAITEPMKLQNITISSYNDYGYYRTSNGVKFQGTYAPIAAGEWGASGVVYGLTTDGHIRKAGANASIKGFRAYFDIPAGTEIKAISFDDIEDAISLIQTDAEENDAIYNVAGQRVQKMQKGINIINGKKILK